MMMTAAYQVGFDAQTAGAFISKNLRTSLLREAGIEPTSETVADFQRGVADAEVKAAADKADQQALNAAMCKSAGVTFDKVGARLYVLGVSYEQSRKLGDCGFKWDSERKARYTAWRKDGSAEQSAADVIAPMLDAEAAEPPKRTAGNGENRDGWSQKDICRQLEIGASRAEMADHEPATEKQCWLLAGLILKDGVDGWKSEILSTSFALTKKGASRQIDYLQSSLQV